MTLTSAENRLILYQSLKEQIDDYAGAY